MGALSWLLPSPAIVDFALTPLPPVAVASSSPGSPSSFDFALDFALERINRSVALSIPAVRRAIHVIDTVATFGLAGWAADGTKLAATDPRISWLAQPDPAKTLFVTLAGTLSDAIWYDRSYWRILDRYATGLPAKARRICPDRVSIVPDPVDEDLVDTIVIDGRSVPLRDVIVFEFAGVGGLQRYGFELLDLYWNLQAAAGNYAKAPHPKAILKNHGQDLTDEEIEALLARWEAARGTRSVGYLNDVVDYETFGWSASELQLTEAREYAALEVARMFGLPAQTIDASTAGSLTYSNVVDRRQDTLEALRPWMTPIEQTLSLNDRRSTPSGVVVPAGISVRFDADAYVRDQPGARFATWASAIASGVLSVPEVRALEPYATTSGPINPGAQP